MPRDIQLQLHHESSHPLERFERRVAEEVVFDADDVRTLLDELPDVRERVEGYKRHVFDKPHRPFEGGAGNVSAAQLMLAGFEPPLDDDAGADEACIGSDVRITPMWLIQIVRAFAGARQLVDVCTQPDNPIGADHFFTEETDGYTYGWSVPLAESATRWANVPYSRGQVQRWSERIVHFARLRFETLLLTKDDIRPEWYRYLTGNCDARCRIHRGVGFAKPLEDGKGYERMVGPRWGSCLWYFGPRRRRFDRIFGAIGEITHGLGPQEDAVRTLESEVAS